MLNTVLTSDFAAAYLGILVLLLPSALLWYYWHVIIPYAKFPSYRYDYRLPFLVLGGKLDNKNVFASLVDLAKRFKDKGMFVIWCVAPYLFIYDEEITKIIVSEQVAIDRPKIYQLFQDVLGSVPLTSNGENWRRQKKLIGPAFNSISLKEHASIINQNAKALVKELSECKSQPTEEILTNIRKWFLRTVVESSVGAKVPNLEAESRLMYIIEELSEFVTYRFWSPWLYPNFMLHLFPYSRKAIRLLEEGRTIGTKMLEEVKESVAARLELQKSSGTDSESYGQKATSFGEILLEQYLTDPSFTMKELRDLVFNLIIATFDPASHALMWCVYLLGLNPDVQERAYQEIMSETEGDVQFDDLHKLTYLECVIKESQRIYTIPIFGRRLNEDVQCGEYSIPKNTTVIIFSYMLHRNPKIYPDPEKFDPERFMAKDSKIRPWHYLPFAEGVRPCIGKNYAMMAMKVNLVHILRNFKIISLDRREDVEVTWAIVLGSAKKLRMKFVPRHLSTPTAG